MNEKYESIYDHAKDIEENRKEEIERQYGPFDESMAKAAKLASEMCNKEITTLDFYKCMIALKQSRLAYSYKYDTFLDMIVYIGALYKYTVKLAKETLKNK